MYYIIVEYLGRVTPTLLIFDNSDQAKSYYDKFILKEYTPRITLYHDQLQLATKSF